MSKNLNNRNGGAGLLFSGFGNSQGMIKSPFFSKIILTLIFVSFAAFYWGAYVDFVPSDFWKKLGSAIAAIIALPLILLIWRRHLTGKARLVYNEITFKPFELLLTYIFLPLIIYFWIFVPIVHSSAAILTMSFGSYEKHEAYFKKTYSQSRYGCDYRLKGIFIKNSFPSYMCISREYYYTQPQNVLMELSGKKSKFGFLINDFREISKAEK